jgi:hypothetical protein
MFRLFTIKFSDGAYTADVYKPYEGGFSSVLVDVKNDKGRCIVPFEIIPNADFAKSLFKVTASGNVMVKTHTLKRVLSDYMACYKSVQAKNLANEFRYSVRPWSKTKGGIIGYLK